MASIVVRGLDESVKRRLAERAREHGRSMEAEVREILTRASHNQHIGLALLEIAQSAQSAPGTEEVLVPARIAPARVADFE